jgi:enterochelin esterase-like enzyme
VGTKEVQENLSHPPTPLYQRTSQLDSVRRLAAGMSRAGHEMHLNEFEGGHDPARWAAEIPEAIGWLLAER